MVAASSVVGEYEEMEEKLDVVPSAEGRKGSGEVGKATVRKLYVGRVCVEN